MLQIISGKFFKTEHVHVTPQRGILYANYASLSPIETRVGTLTPVTVTTSLPAFVYSFENRLEFDPRLRGIQPAALGTREIVSDFATLVSFALQITCSPSQAIVERLTQDANNVRGDIRRPCKYVPRVFDSRVEQTTEDATTVAAWVDAMVGLPRATYLRVMRVMRRYVAALHRIGDDLEVSYLLLVASLESLAQGFDGFDPTWERFSPRQRPRIDAALAAVDDRVVEEIRAALLADEHQALGKRFVEFAVQHIGPSFFREEARGLRNPLRQSDLLPALSAAYGVRSGQVHTLEELPSLLRLFPNADTMRDQLQTLPSLGGLARLVHHVIRTFVHRQPWIAREAYDYRAELPGLVALPVAAKHWIFDATGYTVQTAPRYLTGFLDQLAHTLRDPQEPLTELSAVLERIERTVNGVAESQRLPMLVLYQLYHWYTSAENHRPKHAAVMQRHAESFERPSIEGATVYLLQGERIPWDPEDTLIAFERYLSRRYDRNSVNLGWVFEAAILLEIAEGFRTRGNIERARQIISRAVEEYPGEDRLLRLETEAQADEIPTILWQDILLPLEPSAKASPQPE